MKRNYSSFQRQKPKNYSKKDLGTKSKYIYNRLIKKLERFFGIENLNLFSCYSPHYFKRVKISATALIKIVMHAKRGGDIEVMGLMQGKVKGGRCSFFVISDWLSLKKISS